MKRGTADEASLPYRWRSRLPDTRSIGTMYQFIRDELRRRGGKCSRDELLRTLKSDAVIANRLAASQGFGPLLNNMRNSGEIVVDGDVVAATPRAMRRAATFS